MDFSGFEGLHNDGHDETAWILFAQMCRNAIYGVHRLPDGVSHLVHYTTLEALTSMLGMTEAGGEHVLATRGPSTEENQIGTNGYLRLYDTFSANDPNEGDFFVSSADETHEFRHRYEAIWRLFEDRSAAPAYQTSLTHVEDETKADNLVFWRTYGRDGSGCALAFPVTCFEGQKNLFRVRYGKVAAGECVGRLSALLEAYGEVPGAPDFAGIGNVLELPQPIVNVLSPLVYLYKSKAYEFEREARIVVPFSDLDNGLYLQGSSMGGLLVAWRHYAQLSDLQIKDLLVSNSRILLGPTVETAANVQFVLERLLVERRLYGPKVKQSTISYRR